MCFRPGIITRICEELRDVTRGEPVPGVEILSAPSDTDVLEEKAQFPLNVSVRLTAFDGPMKGTTAVLSILLTTAYPLAPPKVILHTPLCHPNVYSFGICLDMLRPSCGRAYEGWTPAYTLRAVLMQLSTFLMLDEDIGQDYGDSVRRSTLPAALPSPDSSAPAPPLCVNRQDRQDRQDETAAVRSTVSVDMQTLCTVCHRLSFDCLEAVLKKLDPVHLCRITGNVDVDFDVPSIAKKTARKILNARDGKQCFVTKRAPTDNEDDDVVLCIPLHVQRCRDRVQCIVPSVTCLIDKNAPEVENDAWNENTVTHRLPVMLGPRHRQRALKATEEFIDSVEGGYGWSAKKDQNARHRTFIDTMGQIMTTLTAQMMKDDREGSSKHASDAAMKVLFHLHHSIVAYAVEHPELVGMCTRRLREFVENPATRHKQRCANLGILFAYMLLVPEDEVDWSECAPPLMREMLARNVLFAMRDPACGGLRFATNLEDSDFERVTSHFRSARVGLGILALQAWFGNSMMRPRRAAAALHELRNIRDQYDDCCGEPPADMLDTFFKHFRALTTLTKWKEFFANMGLEVRSPDPSTGLQQANIFANTLRQAVIDSENSAYHRRATQTTSAHQRQRAFESWDPSSLPIYAKSRV